MSASIRRDDSRYRKALGDGVTSRNRSWRGTNSSPWRTEGEDGGGGGGRSGRVYYSRTSQEGIVCVLGVRDANAVHQEADSIPSR
jgi:hypothetical protein